jgi:hypothetical protein
MLADLKGVTWKEVKRKVKKAVEIFVKTQY